MHHASIHIEESPGQRKDVSLLLRTMLQPTINARPTAPPIDSHSVLARRLETANIGDLDYWSFRHAKRAHVHNLFQYPAMMVPQLIERLIKDVVEVFPETTTVFDPFVGSGTVLTEAMLAGLEFYGRDVNPLALLLCKVKSGPFSIDALEGEIAKVTRLVDLDRGRRIETELPNWRKWFTPNVAMWLSRIVRSIRSIDDLWTRRFFWVALAETVRVSSNSRTSTFKLHIRSAEDLAQREVDAKNTFTTIVSRNASKMKKFADHLYDKEFLNLDCYINQTRIDYVDRGEFASVKGNDYDLLITSPPYGDNTTTVPYGQHSYLPLNWIDLCDIDDSLDKTILNTTRTIDAKSLGGSLRHSIQDVSALLETAPTLKRIVARLPVAPTALRKKVLCFYYDLDKLVDFILTQMAENATLIWIVGDRRVANIQVPLSIILQELLESKGCSYVTAIKRKIPSKRMAVRNNLAKTMKAETLLIMKK